MKSVLVIFLCIFVILLLFSILFGIIRSIQIKNKPEQKEFIAGKVPSLMPNGLYKRTVKGLKTTWAGKRFDSSNMTGINVFSEQNKMIEKYQFTLSIGKGLQDKDITVLKIDYSHNKHPWWLKFILDEVVETTPGKLLGKVHITIIPGLLFSVGYFRLEK